MFSTRDLPEWEFKLAFPEGEGGPFPGEVHAGGPLQLPGESGARGEGPGEGAPMESGGGGEPGEEGGLL